MKQQSVSIAVDGNEANVINRVGSNRYAFELLQSLEKISQSTAKQVSFTVLLHSDPLKDMPTERKGWQYEVITPKRLWTQWAAPRYLYAHKHQFDLFFSPGHYTPNLCPIPSACTIMDLAFMQYPDSFRWQDRYKLSQWTKKSVHQSRIVFAISKATKQSISKEYAIPSADIVVAYPGRPKPTKLSAKDLSELLKQNQIASPFLLYVGTIQPRKNLPLVVSAFEQFVTRFQTEKLPKGIDPTAIPQLVIAGKTGWLAYTSLAAIRRSSVAARIRLLGYCENDLQTALYTKALATVLVSDHEGFGLPPLESMLYGTIPIVAKNSSLPEVVGDAGIVVPPHSKESLSQAYWDVLTMSKRNRAIYHRAMREQVEKFDWQTSAEVVLKTLLKSVTK